MIVCAVAVFMFTASTLAIESTEKPLAFVPPPDSAIADDEFGSMIKLGEAIFTDTRTHAGAFVGNSLRCSNCHLNAGRLANSASLAQAYVAYPAYRAKNHHVNTFEERLQDCFRYSMNGTAPPAGNKVLTALTVYAFFLARNAPIAFPSPDGATLWLVSRRCRATTRAAKSCSPQNARSVTEQMD